MRPSTADGVVRDAKRARHVVEMTTFVTWKSSPHCRWIVDIVTSSDRGRSWFVVDEDRRF